MSDTSGPAGSIAPVPLMHEVVAEHLTAEIVRGDLKPGERLNEVQLAQRLGISRSPMREALRQLENDGLVVSESRRGTWVAEMDADMVADFYDCRILVEAHCARLAAPFLTDEDIAVASSVLDEMRKTAGSGLIYPRLSLIEQFHEVYRNKCPNAELVALIHRVGRRALRFRAIRIIRAGTEEESIRQHGIILDAMRGRDADLLSTAVADLLEASKEVICTWLTTSAAKAAK